MKKNLPILAIAIVLFSIPSENCFSREVDQNEQLPSSEYIKDPVEPLYPCSSNKGFSVFFFAYKFCV